MVFDALQVGKLTPPEADLAWHVRAWGQRGLNNSRTAWPRFYPNLCRLRKPPINKEDVEWKPETR